MRCSTLNLVHSARRGVRRVVIDTCSQSRNWREAMRDAMRAVALPVVVVTSSSPDPPFTRRGITCSSFTSKVSLDPPILSFSIQKPRIGHPSRFASLLRHSGRCAINVLGEHQAHLGTHFSLPTDTEDNQLSEISHFVHRGLPLLDDTIISFSCSVLKEVEAGTADLFLVQVEEIHTPSDVGSSASSEPNESNLISPTRSRPLLYHGSQYVKCS
ncbi:hypothetical protein M427DRAFT_404324 [Gonapodya prolifera JEL478]|uniref:Flavin reductase like domain-containing protein n=1 Tax=Gonapodya prolifera (strain JEL478) TaxID=1344416 RepID=A0A139AUE9_GONPJ|nr:hypothetical protein M427DRAFT_404324 [Gonapodya prolifera JEL478]|eukprot:KXS20193.1 hypothetical protein M427DRAFT_404324 [Gonapodya prolifera JEL478]